MSSTPRIARISAHLSSTPTATFSVPSRAQEVICNTYALKVDDFDALKAYLEDSPRAAEAKAADKTEAPFAVSCLKVLNPQGEYNAFLWAAYGSDASRLKYAPKAAEQTAEGFPGVSKIMKGVSNLGHGASEYAAMSLCLSF